MELTKTIERLQKIRALNGGKKTTPISIQCNKCQDIGFIFYEKNGVEYVKPCNCTIQKHNEKIIERSGLKELFKTKGFENFKTTNAIQERIKQKCINNSKTNESILISGQVGSGKTHLAVAIMKEQSRQGKPIKYVNYVELMRQLSMVAMDEEEYNKTMNKLKNIAVLMIDDIFKGERITESQLNNTYQLINHRYINNKKTVLTSEKTVHQILQIDEAIGSRIIEMAKDYIIGMSGFKNYRI